MSEPTHEEEFLTQLTTAVCWPPGWRAPPPAVSRPVRRPTSRRSGPPGTPGPVTVTAMRVDGSLVGCAWAPDSRRLAVCGGHGPYLFRFHPAT
jgi:hypothetical protein